MLASLPQEPDIENLRAPPRLQTYQVTTTAFTVIVELDIKFDGRGQTSVALQRTNDYKRREIFTVALNQQSLL